MPFSVADAQQVTVGPNSPGGLNGNIQVKNGGSFGGRAIGTGLTDDGTNIKVTNTSSIDATNAHTVAAGDAGASVWLTNNGAVTITVGSSASLGANFAAMYFCDTGPCTFNSSGSDTINGQTSLVLAGGESVWLQTSGTSVIRASVFGKKSPVYGTGTSGNCMQWGANNAAGDAGAPCGSSSGGDWVKVATVIASNAATISFTSGLTTDTYYWVHCSSVRPHTVGGVNVQMRFSENAGSPWITGAGTAKYTFGYTAGTNAPANANDGGTATFYQVGLGTNSTGPGASLDLLFNNLASSTVEKSFTYVGSTAYDGTVMGTIGGGIGMYTADTNPINGIEFGVGVGTFGSSNIDGKCTLYKLNS